MCCGNCREQIVLCAVGIAGTDSVVCCGEQIVFSVVVIVGNREVLILW